MDNLVQKIIFTKHQRTYTIYGSINEGGGGAYTQNNIFVSRCMDLNLGGGGLYCEVLQYQ